MESGTCTHSWSQQGAWTRTQNRDGIQRVIWAVLSNFQTLACKARHHKHHRNWWPFPQQFCKVRWVENKSCCDLKSSSDSSTKRKSETVKSEPIIKSFENCMKDKLVCAKLNFCKTLSAEFEPFEGDANKINRWFHLFSFLHALIHSLLKRVVSSSVLKTIGTDISEMKKIDLRFGTKYLKECTKTDVGCQPRIHDFQNKRAPRTKSKWLIDRII